MTALQMNADILQRILDVRGQKEEIVLFLEDIMDSELARGDHADCDLIDACVEVLESEETGEHLLRLVSKPAFLRAVHRRSVYYKSRYRTAAAVCACAVLLAAGTAGTLQTKSGQSLARRVQQKLEAVFKNESTAPAPEAPTQPETPTAQVTLPVSEPVTAAPETTTQTASVPQHTAQSVEAPVPTGLYGIFPADLKTEYIVGEKLDMQGVRVVAVFSDKSEREIPLDECFVSTQRGFPQDPGSYTIEVFYQGLSFSYPVRVTAQKESVILNSIYGSFAPDFDFTDETPASPDLSGMTVTAVYSDGSERVLRPEEYEVTVLPNFLDDPDRSLVTVSYMERSFSFILTKEMQ